MEYLFDKECLEEYLKKRVINKLLDGNNLIDKIPHKELTEYLLADINNRYRNWFINFDLEEELSFRIEGILKWHKKIIK